MGAETAAALQVASAVGGVVQGVQQAKAGREEAMETLKASKENARRRREELEKFKGKQRMGFLESGVLLEGSPLLVLEETERKGSEEIQEITEGGFRRANKLRRAGRDAFIGSMFSAAGKTGQAAGELS